MDSGSLGGGGGAALGGNLDGGGPDGKGGGASDGADDGGSGGRMVGGGAIGRGGFEASAKSSYNSSSWSRPLERERRVSEACLIEKEGG